MQPATPTSLATTLLAGMKMPTNGPKTASKASAGRTGSAAPTADIGRLFLDGEDERDFRLYDSCDELRKKITAHSMKAGVTQTHFCRDLIEHLHATGKCWTIGSSSRDASDLFAMR
ncbi:hypothetical protein DOTSEDRAFT_68657 [Dothistroma septosporum NZE10]|uniref:Uncharacterized protein n=1 Tax=Dothistroma septosporum (strain NZE10 / CBS 128990) TaxID=675120 RepID=N1Q515_DOTSN|nr:hypothetical protein DOTSEDRAFT_68657 [Dothistroma septosporum NZE10]